MSFYWNLCLLGFQIFPVLSLQYLYLVFCLCCPRFMFSNLMCQVIANVIFSHSFGINIFYSNVFYVWNIPRNSVILFLYLENWNNIFFCLFFVLTFYLFTSLRFLRCFSLFFFSFNFLCLFRNLDIILNFPIPFLESRQAMIILNFQFLLYNFHDRKS